MLEWTTPHSLDEKNVALIGGEDVSMQPPLVATAPVGTGGEHFTPIAADLLRCLYGHGRASAYAVKLLLIKTREINAGRGRDFVLNRTHLARRHHIGSHQSNAGMRVLRETGVLDRQQPRRNAFAVESLATGRSSPLFVPDGHIDLKADVLAFVVAVRLEPAAVQAADVARRIGVRSPKTAKRLVAEAVAVQPPAVFTTRGTNGRIYVARSLDLLRLGKFDTARTDTAKIDTAQSYQEDLKANEEISKPTECLHNSTRSAREVVSDPDWDLLVLRDWRECEAIQARMRVDGGIKQSLDVMQPAHSVPGCQRSDWIAQLERHGDVPVYLKSSYAHSQAVEIVHEVVWTSKTMAGRALSCPEAMHGLAATVCRAHAAGRVIRSLGFIAKMILERTEQGDLSWVFDLPSTLADEEAAKARRNAEAAITHIRGAGLPHCAERLLSTAGFEELHRMMAQYGWPVIEREIARAKSPGENLSIAAWRYFEAACQASVARPQRRGSRVGGR